MTKNRAWDKYETILLVDYSAKVLKRFLSKQEAVKMLSEELRCKAIKNGEAIGDSFRNENGIGMQMSKMIPLLQRERITLSNPPQVFYAMANIYEHSPEVFSILVRIAKGEEEQDLNIKEQFMLWLSENVPAQQINVILKFLPMVEDFCTEKKILKTPLLETDDIKIVKAVFETIQSNRVFRFTHPTSYSKCREAINYYYKFARIHRDKMMEQPVTAKGNETANSLTSANLSMPLETKKIEDSVRSDLDQEHTANVSAEEQYKLEQNRVNSYIDKPANTEVSKVETEEQTTEEVLAANRQNETIKDLDSLRAEFHLLRPRISAEDKIYFELKQESARNPYGTTVEYLSRKVPVPKNYIERLLSSSIWASQQYGRCKFVSPDMAKVHVVNFDKDSFYAGTAPQSIEYFGEMLMDNCSSWSEVYFEILAALADDYPHVIADIALGKIQAEKPIGIVYLEGKSDLQRPVEFSSGIFAEMPSSSSVIIKYIKRLLILCNIDFENLIIRYMYKDDILNHPIDSKPKTIDTTKTEDAPKTEIIHAAKVSKSIQPERKYLVDQREYFYVWLRDVKKLSERSCSGYVTAVKNAEKFAKNHNLMYNKLFTDNIEAATATAKCLSENDAFCALNNAHHRIFTAGINNYLEFLRNQQPSLNKSEKVVKEHAIVVPIQTNNTLSSQEDTVFVQILKDRFENGFRPTSAIDKNRFKVFYQEATGQTLSMDENQIVHRIEHLGAKIDGRIFAKSDSTQDDLLSEVIEAVRAAFNQGASCVYVESLFARFQERLASSLHIFNADSLRDLVLKQTEREYYARYSYIGSFKVAPDTERDVIKYMRKSFSPVTYDMLSKDLWFIPIEKIKHILVTNKAIVNVAQETYYYAPNLPINTDELKLIEELIEAEFLQKSFISGHELHELIHENCPSLLINTNSFTSWGLRNVLGYLLRDQFNFNGNIISPKGANTSTAQVFAEFCKSHNTVTIDELKELANEMETVIYWEPVYREMVRISATEFINKNQVNFDVDAIDGVLNNLIEDYASIPSINLFLHFPPLQIQWNGFVLESFVFNYSKSFKLLHASFGASDYCGAIVKKSLGIEEYRDLVVTILAENNDWITQMDALQLLVNEGYQMRKALSGIDKITAEAMVLRSSIKK